KQYSLWSDWTFQQTNRSNRGMWSFSSFSFYKPRYNVTGSTEAKPRSGRFIAIEFREEKSLQTLSWPAQSPDLNPIENLWDEIKQSLINEKKKPKNLNELEKNLEVDLSR